MKISTQMKAMTCVSALLFGLAAEAGADTLRLSTLKQPDSAAAASAERFGELVAEKTDGEITVRVYPASQLGDWTEVYEQVIEGAVDMAMQPLATSSDKRLSIVWFPYVFTDYETARTALSPGGIVFDIVEQAIGDQGLTPLAVYGAGMGGAGFATEVKDPANVDTDRNLKVRVWPGGTTHKVMLEAFGYNPATLPWAELYTGMQTGVVDGQVGGTAEMAMESFADITKTWLQLNDHFESDFFFINSDRLAGMSEEHQTAIREAAAEISQAQFDAVEKADEAMLQRMRDNDIEVVTFDPDELDVFADKTRREVWPQIADEIGAETLEQLKAAVGVDG